MKVALIGPNAHLPIHNHPGTTLEQYLLGRGCEIVDDLGVADVICAIEAPVSKLGIARIPVEARSKGLLVIQEPNIVRPKNGSKKVMGKFANVMAVGRPQGTDTILWPVIGPDSISELFKRPKQLRACLVASDNLSFIEGELYSLRRDVLLSGPGIDLYGRGWNRPTKSKLKKLIYETWIAVTSGLGFSKNSVRGFFANQKNYLGQIDSKEDTVSMYKVSVVIENDASYVSEKLLEAIQAGSIPVYVGPELQQFGIPNGIVIQVEANVDAVLAGVESALNLPFDLWSARTLEWLSEIQVSGEWSPKALWDEIHRRLTIISSR